jgi:hypothetical protein
MWARNEKGHFPRGDPLGTISRSGCRPPRRLWLQYIDVEDIKCKSCASCFPSHIARSIHVPYFWARFCPSTLASLAGTRTPNAPITRRQCDASSHRPSRREQDQKRHRGEASGRGVVVVRNSLAHLSVLLCHVLMFPAFTTRSPGPISYVFPSVVSRVRLPFRRTR